MNPRFPPYVVILLVLGFIGVSIGSAVVYSSYISTRSIQACLNDALCYSKLGLFKVLSLQSSLRAQFDVGLILTIIASGLLVYVLVSGSGILKALTRIRGLSSKKTSS